MKVAIIHEAPVPTSTSRQLMMAFMKRAIKAVYLRLSGLVSYISSGEGWVGVGSDSRLEDLDAAIVRGLGSVTTLETLLRRINLLKQLELQKTLVVNPVDSIMKARDKHLSMIELRKAGLLVPETAVAEDVFDAVEIAKKWGKVVIKPLIGSMGYGSILANDPDMVYNVGRLLQMHGLPIYIQKYVRKYDRDIRVFVVGDRVLGAMYRYSPEGTWKTNVSQGARTEVAEVTKELGEVALRAAKALNLLYTGVDIGETDEGYVLYEVNATPQWEGFMRTTGINPAEYIADLVIELARS
ncbi:MAG: RimK family alpha-L-glutamate ligase [Sulfolobales archaeon]|nr:RimK family alpha-L-glutamate ligase [Sulfolobales archaeon]MDW8082319.1 RimK family alpha-L-glutamate ligase [Sulfolobales archaeon]